MSMPGVPPTTEPFATRFPRRPAFLTFIAVAAIAVGALKGCAALSAATTPGMMAAQSSFMKNIGADPRNNSVARMQTETRQHILDILKSHRVLTSGSAAGAAVVAAGLLFGGIGCLSLRIRARQSLIAAFALGLFLEAVTARPTIRMQLEIADANAKMMMQIMRESSGPSAAGIQHWAGTFANTVSSVGIAMALTMMVAYALLFVAGIIYLTRPRVARLFRPG